MSPPLPLAYREVVRLKPRKSRVKTWPLWWFLVAAVFIMGVTIGATLAGA